ncbi:hypothetical protein B6U66_01705 [Candidatus Bathyarchaeota archaeon ex4484_135]|nr:MAG: hypothetical protein B6U66_01705 [Candidatus Bathyarchaeota archaeon ex4484_135]
MRPIITLTTDFGQRDPYVASMKGVILALCPDAAIVDITHDVPKFDVRAGALIMAQAAPWFPKGTVHVGVVDPGVGTARRAIVAVSERYFFVGPDNGLLMPAAMKDGLKAVYAIENRKLMLERVSRTFHGRDIFAPVAARLASGLRPEEVGPVIDDYVVPSFAEPELRESEVRGEVMYIDGFGNVITNIPEGLLAELGISDGSDLEVEVGDRVLRLKLRSAYGEAKPGELTAIIDSWGMFEVAVNLGSAAEELGARPGDKVVVRPARGGRKP